jgi:hypothetical protein
MQPRQIGWRRGETGVGRLLSEREIAMGTEITSTVTRDVEIPSSPQWIVSLRRVGGRENGRAVVMASYPSSNLQKALIRERAELLTAKLSEGVDDHRRKGAAIAMLLGSWPMTAKGGDSGETISAAYLTAVQRDPAWAVEEVCHRIIKGEAEQIDMRFCPTAAQVVHYVNMVKGRFGRELEELEAIIGHEDGNP